MKDKQIGEEAVQCGRLCVSSRLRRLQWGGVVWSWSSGWVAVGHMDWKNESTEMVLERGVVWKRSLFCCEGPMQILFFIFLYVFIASRATDGEKKGIPFLCWLLSCLHSWGWALPRRGARSASGPPPGGTGIYGLGLGLSLVPAPRVR